jgi:hypothetical protein
MKWNEMKCPKALKMTPKRYNKITLKSKVYMVSLVINVVSKTDFGIILVHLVCLKSEK